jgi:hypothetical protein
VSPPASPAFANRLSIRAFSNGWRFRNCPKMTPHFYPFGLNLSKSRHALRQARAQENAVLILDSSLGARLNPGLGGYGGHGSLPLLCRREVGGSLPCAALLITPL